MLVFIEALQKVFLALNEVHPFFFWLNGVL